MLMSIGTDIRPIILQTKKTIRSKTGATKEV